MNTSRADMPDCLRLFALFGIVVVNVQFMAFPYLEQSAAQTTDDLFNGTIRLLVEGVFTLKTFGLFSFMFGVGLGFLMESAERKGLAFSKLYRRRMIGLAVLGFLHGCLFFFGDILLTYAAFGTILYFMRNWAVPRLWKLGLALLVLQALVGAGVSLLGEEEATGLAEYEQWVMTEGGYPDVILFRAGSFLFAFFVLFLVQGISVLGWFCLGLAAVKSGLVNDSGHSLWSAARRYCLVPGLLVSVIAGALIVWGDEILGQVLLFLVAPITTLGYLGVISRIAKQPVAWMKVAMMAGGSSLTIYLGQSILLSTLFAPYGFGLWDQLSYGQAVAAALAVTVCLILTLIIWRRFFRLGPFEWLLRRWTYS